MLEPGPRAKETTYSHIDENVQGMRLCFQKQVNSMFVH